VRYLFLQHEHVETLHMAAVVNTVNYTALSESVVSSFLYSVLLIVCRAHTH